MSNNLVTTKDLVGMRAIDAKRGKRIGKVRRFVFHPTEKRCIGLLIKRPDAALMFHRKDLFVALGGFHVDSEGNVVVHDDTEATDRGAIKALGVNWDACVIWVGMPVITASGEELGYVDVVSFDLRTGKVTSLTTEDGAANSAILGKKVIPTSLVKGFKRGKGSVLVEAGDYRGEEPDETSLRGAILVDDAALDISAEGGVAAAAGKATAVAADQVKKGTARAKVEADKAKKVIDERIEEAKPGAKKFADAAGEAFDSGTFALGKQLGKASGMFAAFKEEFDAALHEDDGN